MATKVNKQVSNGEEELMEEQPMSPSSQCFNSSILSYSILVFFELETEIVDSKIFQLVQQLRLVSNSRFSSIVVQDDKGVQRWRKQSDHDVCLEDHVKVASFPVGLSPKDYDKHLEDYASKIQREGYPEGKPLWQVHLIKYPTSKAVATLLFKLHHALGDGYSLMGVLFSCLQRADDPSLPLTFPTSSNKGNLMMKKRKDILFNKSFQVVSRCWNSILDFANTVLTLRPDDKTVIRSGKPRLEYEPVSISSVSFALQDIALVKSKISGTVNDIVLGIIFYGIRMYMEKMGQKSKYAKNVRAVVSVNTRMMTRYQKVDEMAKKNTYGNRTSSFALRIPPCGPMEETNPMDFVFKAKKMMRRKKNSLAAAFTGRLLRLLGKMKGPEGISRFIYSNSKNTSMGISNLVGPKEKMAMAGHPINGFYFVVMGTPRSLGISIMSYMDRLRLAVRAEKEFIDSELLVSCMKEAFQNIFEYSSSCNSKDQKGYPSRSQ